MIFKVVLVIAITGGQCQSPPIFQNNGHPSWNPRQDFQNRHMPENDPSFMPQSFHPIQPQHILSQSTSGIENRFGSMSPQQLLSPIDGQPVGFIPNGGPGPSVGFNSPLNMQNPFNDQSINSHHQSLGRRRNDEFLEIRNPRGRISEAINNAMEINNRLKQDLQAVTGEADSMLMSPSERNLLKDIQNENVQLRQILKKKTYPLEKKRKDIRRKNVIKQKKKSVEKKKKFTKGLLLGALGALVFGK